MAKKSVLIIGGGLGALITAIILQKHNYQVKIVERNSRVGGLLQSFNRKSCIFDTGMHYLGSLDKGQTMHRIFDYLNVIEKLQLKRMDADGYEIFHIKDNIYKFPFGWLDFSKQLLAYFPDEEVAINKYITKVIEVANSHDLYNLRTPVKNDLSTTSSIEQGAFDFIQSITDNNDLQNLLSAMNSIYAGQKQKSSLYVHAIIHNYYNNSAYRIEGGGEELAKALAKEFTNLGGEIIVNQEIVKFQFEGKSIVNAYSKKGESFNSDYYISSMHPSLTMKMIDDHIVRKSYKKRIVNQKNTISSFGIHVKLKKRVFPNMNYNYHRFLNKDVWSIDNYDAKRWPQEYMVYTPANLKGDEKCMCFSAYTYMMYDEVAQWEGTEIHKRPQNYTDWKAKKTDRLLELIEKDFPEIKGNVDFVEALSPLSYHDYVNNMAGEIYGIEHDFNHPFNTHIFPRTKVSNLFFTGQNINMHGLLGVALGSLLTVNEFVSMDGIINEINKDYN